MKAHERAMLLMENKPGIYAINNQITGSVYVGSSTKVSLRLSQHRWALKRGDHVNGHLQSSWDKHGEEVFTYETLEYCSEFSLLEKEQWWIREKGADGLNGYNLASAKREAKPNLKASLARKRRWEGLSDDERRAKASYFVNDEVRKGNSERLKERWKDPEFRKKRLEGLARGRDKTNARKDPAILANLTAGRAKAIHNSRTNPARKELQRSIALANWENPETRAKAIENLNAGRIAINDRKKANAKAKREQQ